MIRKHRVFYKEQTAELLLIFSLGTYFNKLASDSISMPCIIPFIKHQKQMLQKRVLQHLLIGDRPQ